MAMVLHFFREPFHRDERKSLIEKSCKIPSLSFYWKASGQVIQTLSFISAGIRQRKWRTARTRLCESVWGRGDEMGWKKIYI